MLVTRCSGRTSAPLPLGERQVVAVERVLGVDLAADVAVADVHAGALLDAVRIDEALAVARVEGGGQRVVPLGVEGDRQLQLLEARAGADRLGRLPHQLHLLGPLAVRHLLHVHDAAHGLVVRRHRLPGDLRRPALVEHRLVGHRRDVGVDQRAAADGRALRHRHVLEHAQVEPAVPALGHARCSTTRGRRPCADRSWHPSAGRARGPARGSRPPPAGRR